MPRKDSFLHVEIWIKDSSSKNAHISLKTADHAMTILPIINQLPIPTYDYSFTTKHTRDQHLEGRKPDKEFFFYSLQNINIINAFQKMTNGKWICTHPSPVEFTFQLLREGGLLEKLSIASPAFWKQKEVFLNMDVNGLICMLEKSKVRELSVYPQTKAYDQKVDYASIPCQIF